MHNVPGQPDNVNYLSPLGFRFVIKKLPHVNYFCQNVSIPSVSLGVTEYSTPLINIPFPGGKLSYEPLTIRFKVDEDLKNYIEVYNWLLGLGHPISLNQTRDLSRTAEIPALREGAASSFVSDGTLVVLTSHKNPSHSVTFRDMFPIALSELQFDSTDVDVIHLEGIATFRYRSFEIATV